MVERVSTAFLRMTRMVTGTGAATAETRRFLESVAQKAFETDDAVAAVSDGVTTLAANPEPVPVAVSNTKRLQDMIDSLEVRQV